MENKRYVIKFEEAKGNAEKEMKLWRNHIVPCTEHTSIAKRRGNDNLNFYEIIWENDVESFVDLCRKNNIAEIMISGVSLNVLEILASFEQCGCKLKELNLH